MVRSAARPIAVGLLALTFAQGCSTLRRPIVRSSLDPSVHKAIGVTVEAQDRALAAALLRLRLVPSAAHHRAVADEYRRLRIDDAAFDHLVAATRLDRQDAAAYDALARIWRDWGFPHLGMGDAARAVYYAPASAAAHNTRGTLLAAAGHWEAARHEFETALALDPRAAFAAANLCYLELLAGQVTRAADGCGKSNAIELSKATGK